MQSIDLIHSLECKVIKTSVSSTNTSSQTFAPFAGSFINLKSRLHDTTLVKAVVKPVWQPVVSCIQTFSRLSNPFDNRLDVCLHDTAGCQTVVQPVWQPAVSCKRGITICCSHCNQSLRQFAYITDLRLITADHVVIRIHIWAVSLYHISRRINSEVSRAIFGSKCNFRVSQSSVVTHLRWGEKSIQRAHRRIERSANKIF